MVGVFVTQTGIEALRQPETAATRVTQVGTEVLRDSTLAKFRATQVAIEVLRLNAAGGGGVAGARRVIMIMGG